MSIKGETYLKFSAGGAAFGITTSVLSGAIGYLTRQSLGLAPLNLKNVLKTGVLGGGTAALILAGEEHFHLLTKIEKMVG